jgi:hypothetical protein
VRPPQWFGSVVADEVIECCALPRLLSRERGDGDEIGRLRVTYLITDGSAGRRISALLVHSAPALEP